MFKLLFHPELYNHWKVNWFFQKSKIEQIRRTWSRSSERKLGRVIADHVRERRTTKRSLGGRRDSLWRSEKQLQSAAKGLRMFGRKENYRENGVEERTPCRSLLHAAAVVGWKTFLTRNQQQQKHKMEKKMKKNIIKLIIICAPFL